MNRKGFTLIELIAVIVILGIILIVSVPSFSNAYKESKLKSEEIFVERLSQSIDSYIKLNSDEIAFTSDGTANKEEEGSTYQVNIWKSAITVQNVIDDKLISEEDFVNPGNKDYINPVTSRKSCNTTTAEIEVYKDSDYVYCHKIKKDSLGCLTDEYKNSITGEYAVDTCIWSR